MSINYVRNFSGPVSNKERGGNEAEWIEHRTPVQGPFWPLAGAVHGSLVFSSSVTGGRMCNHVMLIYNICFTVSFHCLMGDWSIFVSQATNCK